MAINIFTSYCFQFAIVNHFIIDGATHICQLMEICGVKNQIEKAYTCDECVKGLDFVQAYDSF